jgi:hypothetical protein
MFYDFLLQRNQSKLFENTQTALSSIASINEKIEDLTKNILRRVDSVNAENVITKIDNENEARQFFIKIKTLFKTESLESIIDEPNKLVEQYIHWFDFISKLYQFQLVQNVSHHDLENKTRKGSVVIYNNSIVVMYDGEMTNLEKKDNELLVQYYGSLRKLETEKRIKILNENILTIPF